MKKKVNCLKILDYIMCILLLLLSIKKGGFYKSDTILFNLGVNIVAIISVSISYFKKDKQKENNKLSILLLIFSLTYLIPVIIRNYSSLNDSIFEMIRYFNLYLIYLIVRKSENKGIYKSSIIIISVILVIFGVDQIANGYFANVLKNLNSGYLTENNIDRMSSTIQYANVFALICMVAYILCVENVVKNKWNYYINSLLQLILLSGIILSGSRVMIAIAIAIIIYNIVRNKQIAKNVILNLLYTLIYTIIINKLITTNLFMIYVVTIVAYVLNIILNYLIKKYSVCFSKKIEKIKNKKVFKYIIILIAIVILVISFTIRTSIKVDSNSNKPIIPRNIYNFDNLIDNVLHINVDELEEDTRYKIGVIEVYEDGSSKVISDLHYYTNTTGEFDVEIKSNKELKYININFECYKGSLEVKDIKLNGKQVGMDYLLLPSNLIYRVVDGIYNSNSLNLRIKYLKDAIKISTDNLKNFVFGIGGEGFRNEYKYYISSVYNSTEVHNIYIQTLIESGILGLTTFISIIIYILLKYKLSPEKIAVICILIHGIFDLDFSYMIIIAIFAILLGLLEEKETSVEKSTKDVINKVYNYIENVIGISMWLIITIILIFSNIASFIKVNQISELDDINTIESKLVNYERKASFDRFETKYKLQLNEEYSTYMKKIIEQGLNENNTSKLINTSNKLLASVDYLQKNECKNTSNVFNISNQYFNNMKYFSLVNYPKDIYEGYDIYLKYVYENMKILSKCDDDNIKLKVKKICGEYIKALKLLDNDITNKYVNLLENIV